MCEWLSINILKYNHRGRIIDPCLNSYWITEEVIPHTNVSIPMILAQSMLESSPTLKEKEKQKW